MWFVYILCCADGTLYTGVTTDPQRRLAEHNAGGRLAARYTRARRPVQLVHQEQAANRAEACRREAEIKKLKREAKLAFLPSPIGGEGTASTPPQPQAKGIRSKPGLAPIACSNPPPNPA
jgi:putative endonuclease